MAEPSDTTRRQFMASATAVSLASRYPIEAAKGSLPVLPDLPELPIIYGFAVSASKVEAFLAHVDANGAEYRGRGDGWFEVRWLEPSVGRTWRFATNADIHPEETEFARYFEMRALNT